MNKKSLLTVLTVSLVWIGTVFADIDIGNNGAGSIGSPGAITNSGNNNIIYGSGSAASVTNQGGQGGSATIQAGAVQNNNSVVATGGAGGAGGSAIINDNSKITNTNTNMNTNTNTNINTNTNMNTNTNVNANTNVNTNINRNLVYSTNKQAQGQEQSQGQLQGQIQGQMNNWSQTYINERELPNIIGVQMPVTPLVSGRIGDVTATLVKFAIAAKPYAGESVLKVLKIVKGSLFDRVRLEDIEIELLKAYKELCQKVDGKKIRYLVQYKDSAQGTSLGFGGAGGISALNGGSDIYGGSGSIGTGLGWARSTADPMYIIKFFLIE